MTAQEQSKHFTAVSLSNTSVWDLPFDSPFDLQGCKVILYFVLISWFISVDEIRYDNNSGQIQNVAFDTAVPHSYEAFPFLYKKKKKKSYRRDDNSTTLLCLSMPFFFIYTRNYYILYGFVVTWITEKFNFFSAIFFSKHRWSKLYPSHAILKTFCQIITSSEVVMRPGEMTRGPMTRLSRLIPVSGSLCLLCCVFRERGGE